MRGGSGSCDVTKTAGGRPEKLGLEKPGTLWAACLLTVYFK